MCVCTACVISSPRFESFGRVCVCVSEFFICLGEKNRDFDEIKMAHLFVIFIIPLILTYLCICVVVVNSALIL